MRPQRRRVLGQVRETARTGTDTSGSAFVPETHSHSSRGAQGSRPALACGHLPVTNPDAHFVKPVTTSGLPHLGADLERIDTALRGAVSSPEPMLADAGAHLLGSGKRVRSTLTLVCAAAVTGADRPATEQAVTGAVACELVHMGSLYHDDVIDEAETRRGIPSVNARWSNIVAILAGDHLLARASSLAASLGADVAGLLAATIAELCRGEVGELTHLFDVERSEESYYSAIEGKTAALFATSCRIGAMVSDAGLPITDALTRFGTHLGMCFQIIDDCLDLTSTDATLGKPAGQDLVEGIYTLPVIYALRESPELRAALGGPIPEGSLDELRAQVVASGAVEAANGVAADHASKAMESLRGADGLDSEVVAWLAGYADRLAARDR